MGAVWLRARAQLRGRVWASLLLALLVGLASGLVLAALAGARRSDAALPRFLAASRTTDTLVYVAGPSGQPGQPARTDLAEELRAVAALPQVRAAQRLSPLIMSASDPTGPARPSRQLGWVGLDRPGNEGFGRPMVVAGRLPRPDRPEEAAVDEEFAWRHGLRAGSAFRIGTYTRAQFGPAGEGVPIPPEGPAADLRVTGILRFPDDLLPVAEGRNEVDADESSQLYLTPAFWRRYGPDLANYGITIAVDLHRDQAGLSAFTAAVQRRFAGQAFVSAAEFDEEGDLALGVRRATALETAALLAFATLAALTALLLVGQTLGRQVLLESTEYPTLRALGMTRGQLVGVALVRAAVIGAGGAALAVAAAVALSPLTPIGVGRRAELDPGVAADWPVLTAGALAIVVLVAVGAALPAWRAAGARGDPQGGVTPARARRPSRVAAALAGTGVPPTAVIGVRLALEPGRGRSAVPVRAALAGAVAAVCAVTAAAGFGASLTRLVSTPPDYGAAWDVAVGGFAPTAAAEPVAGQLLANPEVAAVAALLGQSEVTINGRLVSILAIEERKGALPPAVIEGREPLRPDEIALGSLTLRSLGRRVGDTVTLAAERRPARPLRVVGRVVLNQPGCDCVITQGKGGIVHPDLYRDLALEPELAGPSTFLVRLDPGVDRDRAMARLRRDFAGTMFSPRPHADVRNLQRVADLPGLLAALVALVALGTVTHALVTSVRRRRRDLAVLKTLGFVRGQVAATVAWQASTFAVVALGLGLPLGIAAGRWAWQLTAAALGVASGPVVPLLAIVAAASGTVLAVNLAAAVPGWAAGRLRPATVLRSE
jgi:ABC-type lipoprotein release transport system permease subunit